MITPNRTARALSTLLFTATCAVLMLVTPAGAEVPEGWSDPAPVAWLDALFLTIGAPLLIGAAVALLSYLSVKMSGIPARPASAMVGQAPERKQLH